MYEGDRGYIGLALILELPARPSCLARGLVEPGRKQSPDKAGEEAVFVLESPAPVHGKRPHSQTPLTARSCMNHLDTLPDKTRSERCRSCFTPLTITAHVTDTARSRQTALKPKGWPNVAVIHCRDNAVMACCVEIFLLFITCRS